MIANRADNGPMISNTTVVAAIVVTMSVPISGIPNDERLCEANNASPIATPA